MTGRSSHQVRTSRFGALAMAALALGCAAIAAMMVSRMLKARGYTGSEVRPLVVAKEDLPAGVPVRPEQLTVVDWPRSTAPAGSFATVEALLKSSNDPVPTAGILAGEPVVAARLSSDKSGTGVVRLLKENMRAVAVKVDDAIGQTGLVYPGATVDVIVTIRDPESRTPSSRIAVQNARVLTVGADSDVATRRRRKSADTGPTRNTYLTLEVTPRDAEIIAMGRNEGRIDIALRSSTDMDSVETDGATPVALTASEDEIEYVAEPEEIAPAPKPAPKPAAKKKSRKSKRRAKDTKKKTSKRDRAPERSGGRKIRLVAK
jgi:pilus assembly protein CpaB